MSTTPSHTGQRRIDRRVAGWATETLQAACANLDYADDLTGELTRYVHQLAPEWELTDPHLIEQVINACHAAIGLTLITDYHCARVIDPHDACDPVKTAAAVAGVFARFTRELRWGLIFRAAEKISVYS